jgi:hypothetical protein
MRSIKAAALLVLSWTALSLTAACVAGLAIEVLDDVGRRALVVGLRGQQVSNDHYPYYEASYRWDGSGWELDRAQRYFYDIAGIEGFEAPALAAVFTILTFAAACGVAIVYSATRWMSARARLGQEDEAGGRPPAGDEAWRE